MRTIGLQLCILLFIASYSYAQPVVRFDHITYDVPAIGQEAQVEHAFEFVNAGDQELVIDKLDAS